MATLEGSSIASTYTQLLKITSASLGADDSAKYIEDGAGTDSALSLSTTRVGIGTAAPDALLHIKGAASKIVMEETGADKVALISGGDGDLVVQVNSGVSNDNRLIVYKTSADVKVAAGDLIFGTAGKGICLGVTSNTDSNTLDDFEKGTFSPSLYDDTSASTWAGSVADSGKYTKIGNVVNCWGSVTWSSKAAGANGTVRFNDVPFDCFSNNYKVASGAMTESTDNIHGFQLKSTGNANVMVNSSGVVMVTSDFSASGTIYFHFNYPSS